MRGTLRELVLRPSDLPKLLPMQLYYFKLRKEPPPHGTYNPLQKRAYTVVLFGFFPLIDRHRPDALARRRRGGAVADRGSSAGASSRAPGTSRSWRCCIGYFATHIALVATTGAWNNMRSMITGWYTLRADESDVTGVEDR